MKTVNNPSRHINERLLLLLDDLDAIVYVIDIDTYEVLYINKHGKALWGDITGTQCWESVRIGQTGPCPGCNNQKNLLLNDYYQDIYFDPINNKWLDLRGHLIEWVSGRLAKLGIALDITDQKTMEKELENRELKLKMSEEALLESEQLFRSIVDNAPSIIYTIDLNGCFSFVSSSCKEFLGYESSELEGRHFREFIHPEDTGLYQGFVDMMAIGNTQKGLLYRMRHKDGSWHWYRTSGSTIKDKNGEIRFYIGVTSDITEQVEYQKKILRANQELEAALEEIISIEEELRQQYAHLEKHEKELQDSKQLQEDIIGFLPDATCVIDKQGKILFWNRAMENLTGVKAEKVVGKGNYEYAYCLYGERKPILVDLVLNYDANIASRYKNLKILDNNVLTIENYSLKSHPQKFFSLKAAPLYNTNGELIGAVEALRDVTNRRQAENELRYNAGHDSLTGLFNRSYFEKILKKGKNKPGRIIGIIVCDIDGLKLVNDTLGHQEGDILLITCAGILKACCPKNSVISRIGGDEFCLVIRDTTENALFSVLERIDKAVEDYNGVNPIIPLSMSLGAACSDKNNVEMLKLLKEAEEKMSYEKLLHSQSAKSNVVDVMMKALEARDFITEGHADRLSEIIEKIAAYLGMPSHKISSLRLFARFHDIGKVGISDTILFKRGKLTKDEFLEMQKHSEIGFRIAQAAPDLAHISDWILKHHEWWNGDGYPFGLKGEEIPLECRILAVADAFDSMNNDRPYRKALQFEESIAELRRNAGTQFDPKVVEIFLEILEKDSSLFR